jgi:hypothetical protein
MSKETREKLMEVKSSMISEEIRSSRGLLSLVRRLEDSLGSVEAALSSRPSVLRLEEESVYLTDFHSSTYNIEVPGQYDEVKNRICIYKSTKIS